MGNDISTVGGAIATVATSVAAGVTFGQVEALNQAVVDCAKYTAEKAPQTLVRHVGETAAYATATAGTAVVAGVTFGQVDALNDAVKKTALLTAESSETAGKEIVEVVDGYSDAIPGIGHAKGAILYAAGATERGHRAMKASTRTIGVIGGGVGGALIGGPVGAIAGGMAGGAAMDGVITGFDSLAHGEFRPNGQIQAWHTAVNSDDKMKRIDGFIDATTITPFFDAVGGRGAGKMPQHFVEGGFRKVLKPEPNLIDNVKAENSDNSVNAMLTIAGAMATAGTYAVRPLLGPPTGDLALLHDPWKKMTETCAEFTKEKASLIR